MFCKKDALRNFAKFTGKQLYQSLFLNKVAYPGLTQVFSCEFCEISKNTFFHKTPLVAASKVLGIIYILLIFAPDILKSSSNLTQSNDAKLRNFYQKRFSNNSKTLKNVNQIQRKQVNGTIPKNFKNSKNNSEKCTHTCADVLKNKCSAKMSQNTQNTLCRSLFSIRLNASSCQLY